MAPTTAQTTAVSAHIARRFPPRGTILHTGRAVLHLGSDTLPVDIYPEDPAHLFLIGEECIRLAHEWNDRQDQHAAYLADERRRHRLAEDESPASHRADLHDVGYDAVTEDEVAWG